MAEPLRPIFEEYGITQHDLRQALGLSQTGVWRWWSGYQAMSAQHAQEIERRFGVPKWRLRPDLWDPPPVGRRPRTSETTS
jgi:transcriptional regulator with XRE-family HTH domain